MDTSLFQKYKFRDQYIDALKGAAILLVIIGHSIQTNVSNYGENAVFRLIYSFHMPLFMLISGFILFGHIKNPLHIWIFEKFKRLGVPFFAWGLVYYFTKYSSQSFIQYYFDLVFNPGLGLWYLWVLFLNCSLLGIILFFKKEYIELKLLIICLLIQFIPFNSLTLLLIKLHFPFFAAGYIIGLHKNKIPKLKNLIFILALLFPFLVIFWEYKYEPSTTQTIFRYLTAFAGISLFSLIIKYLGKYNISFLSWLGMFTLDIYAIHPLFLSWGVGEGSFKIFSVILIVLSMSVIISFCLRQSKFLSMIFLGKRISN